MILWFLGRFRGCTAVQGTLNKPFRDGDSGSSNPQKLLPSFFSERIFIKFCFVKMEVLVKSGTRAESIAMIVFLCALIVQIECMTR